jgi:hypothetical protein
MPTQTKHFNVNGLVPAHSPDLARKRGVRLPVGTTIPQGTVLGDVTTITPVSQVMTLTISGGSPTGFTGNIIFTCGAGALIGTLANAVTTIPTAAQMQAAFDSIFGVGNTVVTYASLVYTITFAGHLANCRIGSNNTAYGGTFSSTLTFTGGSSPSAAFATTTKGTCGVGQVDVYASGNSDGTQTAKGFLAYDQTSGSIGDLITEWGSGGSPFSPTVMFIYGFFRCGDLIGMDANAVTTIGGRLSEGTDVTNADTVFGF